LVVVVVVLISTLAMSRKYKYMMGPNNSCCAPTYARPIHTENSRVFFTLRMEPASSESVEATTPADTRRMSRTALIVQEKNQRQLPEDQQPQKRFETETKSLLMLVPSVVMKFAGGLYDGVASLAGISTADTVADTVRRNSFPFGRYVS
jgi:hypothetical protein